MIKKETVSLRINPALWKEARKTAIDMDLSVSDLMEKALIKFLKKKRSHGEEVMDMVVGKK